MPQPKPKYRYEAQIEKEYASRTNADVHRFGSAKALAENITLWDHADLGLEEATITIRRIKVEE